MVASCANCEAITSMLVIARLAVTDKHPEAGSEHKTYCRYQNQSVSHIKFIHLACFEKIKRF